MITLNNILVATDFGEASDAALRYGRELAKRFDATLHVLHGRRERRDRHVRRGDVRGGRAPAAEEIEAAARQACDEALIDSDHSGPVTRPIGADVELAGIRHRRLRARARHRPHRHGHPRPRRSRALSDGQRRRACRPAGPVPGADGAAVRSATSSSRTRAYSSRG